MSDKKLNAIKSFNHNAKTYTEIYKFWMDKGIILTGLPLRKANKKEYNYARSSIEIDGESYHLIPADLSYCKDFELIDFYLYVSFCGFKRGISPFEVVFLQEEDEFGSQSSKKLEETILIHQRLLALVDLGYFEITQEENCLHDTFFEGLEENDN